MSALNTTGATIAVVLGGTNVPLPSNQVLNGFTANAANDTFTATQAGTYMISYSIRTTAALQMSSQVLLNGAPLAGTIVAPAAAADTFSAGVITTLAAGDTLSLQLFGILGAAVLQGGNGAGLTVLRLS